MTDWPQPHDIPVVVFSIENRGIISDFEITEIARPQDWKPQWGRVLLFEESDGIPTKPIPRQYVVLVGGEGIHLHYQLHKARYLFPEEEMAEYCWYSHCQGVGPIFPLHQCNGGARIQTGVLYNKSQNFGPIHNSKLYELVARTLGIKTPREG